MTGQVHHDAQQLESMLLQQRTRVQGLAPETGSSQAPVTPVLGGLDASVVSRAPALTCTNVQTLPQP